MLALIFEGTILSTVREGGWFTLPDNSRVSPAVDGWSNEEGYSLQTILPADPVPEGKISLGQSIQLVNGSPQWVHDLTDPSTDPNDYPLNRFQFEAFAMILGMPFSTIEAAINNLPITDDEKAVAISRVRNANTYYRNHPLIESLKGPLGIADAEIDAAWLQAKDLT